MEDNQQTFVAVSVAHSNSCVGKMYDDIISLLQGEAVSITFPPTRSSGSLTSKEETVMPSNYNEEIGPISTPITHNYRVPPAFLVACREPIQQLLRQVYALPTSSSTNGPKWSAQTSESSDWTDWSSFNKLSAWKGSIERDSPQPSAAFLRASKDIPWWKYKNLATAHERACTFASIRRYRQKKSKKSGANREMTLDYDRENGELDGDAHASIEECDFEKQVEEDESAESFDSIVRRARERFLYKKIENDRGETELMQRTLEERLALALAYYMNAWESFSSKPSHRSEPAAFPWTVATDHLLFLARLYREPTKS